MVAMDESGPEGTRAGARTLIACRLKCITAPSPTTLSSITSAERLFVFDRTICGLLLDPTISEIATPRPPSEHSAIRAIWGTLTMASSKMVAGIAAPAIGVEPVNFMNAAVLKLHPVADTWYWPTYAIHRRPLGPARRPRPGRRCSAGRSSFPGTP